MECSLVVSCFVSGVFRFSCGLDGEVCWCWSLFLCSALVVGGGVPPFRVFCLVTEEYPCDLRLVQGAGK